LAQRDLKVLYTVFYLEFDAETYAPVTRDSIERHNDCRFQLESSSADGESLLKILRGSPNGGLDNDVVRLKVVGPKNGPVFVDKLGGVLWSGSAERAILSRHQFAALREMMDRLAKLHRCGRYSVDSE
jgi:hypothetical protein